MIDSIAHYQLDRLREEIGAHFLVPLDQIAFEQQRGATVVVIASHRFRYRRGNWSNDGPLLSMQRVDIPRLQLAGTARTGWCRLTASRTARTPERLLAILRQEDTAVRRAARSHEGRNAAAARPEKVAR